MKALWMRPMCRVYFQLRGAIKKEMCKREEMVNEATIKKNTMALSLL